MASGIGDLERLLAALLGGQTSGTLTNPGSLIAGDFETLLRMSSESVTATLNPGALWGTAVWGEFVWGGP